MQHQPWSARRRAGRFLVECLVVTILLGATTLVMVSLTRSVFWSMQTAQATADAWSRANAVVETAMAAPCTITPATGAFTNARLDMQWTVQPQGSLREHVLTVRLTPSAFAGTAGAPTMLRAAQVCP